MLGPAARDERADLLRRAFAGSSGSLLDTVRGVVYEVHPMPIAARDLDGGVRVLAVDRPPANAIDLQLLADLAAAVAAADADDSVRSVVVTGAGRFFSGGLDLKAMATGQAREMAGFGGADGIFQLWTLGKPTLAMVNGHAIAGGCVLALACDFRIAAAGAYKIGLNETAIGLALPTGAFEIARLVLPRRHVRAALLDGDLYDPDGARTVGLVDRVVAADQLEAVCFERARRLAAYPTAAYAANKYAWQRLAIERVRSEPQEVRDRIMRAWTSEETQRTFAARIAAVAKR
jgi:enoyl-CoA hydratase